MILAFKRIPFNYEKNKIREFFNVPISIIEKQYCL